MQKLTSLIGGTVMVFIHITFRLNMPLACCLGLCADLTTCKLWQHIIHFQKPYQSWGPWRQQYHPANGYLITIAQTLTA